MIRLLLRWLLLINLLACAGIVGARLIDLPQGDAQRGAILYGNNLYCAACHINTDGFAPQMDNLFERVTSLRVPATHDTPDQYLAESVIQPDAYIVPEYRASVMPEYHFCPINCRGFSVTLRDLQDLVAYLRTV